MDRAEVEKISKALADETRLTILEDISASPGLTCGQIVLQRGLTPATISHHLKVLQDAGLIECRKEGQFVHSRAIPARMKGYAAALQRIAGARTSRKAAHGKG